MRDKRFVAIHRGGELAPEDHRKLMAWAICCMERALPYCGGVVDPVLMEAIESAKRWAVGKASTGEVMKASRIVHAFARTIEDPVRRSIARAIGQGVATGHMADHSLGVALYSLKALKLMGRPTDVEREWQMNQLKDLPEALVALITETMQAKGKAFGLW